MAIVSLDEFMTGLIAALRVKECEVITWADISLFEAFEAAFNRLMERQDELGISVRFRIRLQTLYRESQTVYNGIAGAASRGLAGFLDHRQREWRLFLTKEEAERLFAVLPLGEDIWLSLADVFLSTIRGEASQDQSRDSAVAES